jgi:alkanesulfonate monooxygenase SsuD/methylene tetrahydromethanopterin reductase-like flavin-dependent oxidoreductase (luciferase family)
MRVGAIVLPDRPWAEVSSDWSLAEELGIDHCWTFDHLTMGAHSSVPWHAFAPVLAAAALATSRMQIGVLVATPNLHHPVTLSHTLATLHSIAGGRFIAGLGSGGRGPDATAQHLEPLSTADRIDRYGEFVDVLTGMLGGEVSAYSGRFFQVGRAQLRIPAGDLPLWVAATGRRAMRIAARHGAGWVTNAAVDELEAQAVMFDAACAECGRDPRSPARVVEMSSTRRSELDSAAALVEEEERLADLGYTDLVVPFRGGDVALRGWLASR